MKRRLVTPQEILTLHYQGIQSLVVPENAIITPGAKDLILALSFKVIRGEEAPAAAPAAATEPVGGSLDERLRQVVADLAPQLDQELQEQVVQAVLRQIGNT